MKKLHRCYIVGILRNNANISIYYYLVPHKTLGVKRCRAKQKWVHLQDTLNLTDQRRRIKMDESVHSDNCKKLSKEVSHAIKKDKEAYVTQQCEYS